MTRLLTGAVLAGGQSKRFGQPKTTYEFNGKPMLVHVLDTLAKVCDERIVVAKEATPLPLLSPEVRVVYDEFALQHPLNGLLTALQQSRYEAVFICAADMPFLNACLLMKMKQWLEDEDVLVPEADELLQPLHAIYQRKMTARLLSLIQQSPPPALRQVLCNPILKVRVLRTEEWGPYDPDRRSFRNLNTPEV